MLLLSSLSLAVLTVKKRRAGKLQFCSLIFQFLHFGRKFYDKKSIF